MTQESSSGALTTAYHVFGLVIAVLFFFSPALWVWFFQDDFAWLRWGIGFGQDLRTAFTTLTGAGTYRPLTQQVFFGLGRQLFDLNAAAFHVVGITVHALNTVLAYFILRRLVRHPVAAWAGAFFYGAHYAHIWAIFWLSAFTETGLIFCQFLGLWAYMRYLNTGSKRYYALSLLALVVGIFSKENIVTMPFLLALYTLFARRYRNLRHLLPHLVIALGYAGLRLAIGVFPSGPYRPEWGWSIVTTLVQYYQHTFGVYDFWRAVPRVSQMEVALLMALLAGLSVIFVALRFRATRWPIFGLAYFLVAIAPLLIYPHHFTDYYLGVPLLGLAVVVADFFDFWCERPRPQWLRWVLTAAILFYVGGTALEFRMGGQWFIERGRYAHRLFQSTQQTFRDVPGGCAAHIRGVTDDSYFIFIQTSGLHLAGFHGTVYLVPWRENIREFDPYILTPERRAKTDCLVELEFAGGQFHLQETIRSDERLPVGAHGPN